MPLIAVFWIETKGPGFVRSYGPLLIVIGPLTNALIGMFAMIRQQNTTTKMLVAEVQDLRRFVEQQNVNPPTPVQ